MGIQKEMEERELGKTLTKLVTCMLEVINQETPKWFKGLANHSELHMPPHFKECKTNKTIFLNNNHVLEPFIDYIHKIILFGNGGLKIQLVSCSWNHTHSDVCGLFPFCIWKIKITAGNCMRHLNSSSIFTQT